MHSLWFVQWDSTRRDHLGNLGRVSGSGPVKISRFLQNSEGVLEGYLKNEHGFKLISCLSWFAKTLEV